MGRLFFANTNGTLGAEGRDFHLTQNEHGRWHFEHGPGPDPLVSLTDFEPKRRKSNPA